jgi:hypothetical protein
MTSRASVGGIKSLEGEERTASQMMREHDERLPQLHQYNINTTFLVFNGWGGSEPIFCPGKAFDRN